MKSILYKSTASASALFNNKSFVKRTTLNDSFIEYMQRYDNGDIVYKCAGINKYGVCYTGVVLTEGANEGKFFYQIDTKETYLKVKDNPELLYN